MSMYNSVEYFNNLNYFRNRGEIMERINKILTDPFFHECINKTKELEKDRLFCKHGLDHLVDVSRISYIIALESGRINTIKLKLNTEDINQLKEVIYAAGILHDIGRWKEYEDGSDHAVIGSTMAEPVLKRAGFDKQEILIITTAISQHRGQEGERSVLGEVLWLADDYSRGCMECQGRDGCYKVEQMPRGKVNILY